MLLLFGYICIWLFCRIFRGVFWGCGEVGMEKSLISCCLFWEFFYNVGKFVKRRYLKNIKFMFFSFMMILMFFDFGDVLLFIVFFDFDIRLFI